MFLSVVQLHHLCFSDVDLQASLFCLLSEPGKLGLCMLLLVGQKADAVCKIQVLQLFGEGPLDTGVALWFFS